MATKNPVLAWVGRHRVWSAVLGLVVLALVGAAIGGCSTSSADDGSVPTSSQPAPTTSSASATTVVTPTVQVPDVLGLALKQAKTKLRSAGLVVTVEQKYSPEDPWTVLHVSSPSGTEVDEGTTITLSVAKPLPKVPNVIGQTASVATSRLKDAGYKVTMTKATSSATAGTVISVSPSVGTELLPGKTVKIVVAKAAPTPTNNCTPGYSPCLPVGPSDYDCYGGSGNGPAYTEPGVTYRVSGYDPYDLDSDGDGYGCE
jgi:hypothetical protein